MDVADLVRAIAAYEAEHGEPPPEHEYPDDLPYGLVELCGTGRDRVRVTARGYEKHCPEDWRRIEDMRAQLDGLEPGEHTAAELGEARHVTAALQADHRWTGPITRSLYAEAGVWQRANRRWQWRETGKEARDPAPAPQRARKGVGGPKRDALGVLLQRAAEEGVGAGVAAIWAWLRRQPGVKMDGMTVRLGERSWGRRAIGKRWATVRKSVA